MSEQPNTIKTRSRKGTLVDRVDNPDKANRINMQTKADSEAVEKEEPEKGILSSPRTLQEKLANYNKQMTMQAVLDCLTNPDAKKTEKKNLIIKA